MKEKVKEWIHENWEIIPILIFSLLLMLCILFVAIEYANIYEAFPKLQVLGKQP
jgi:hypothetical protein